MKRRADGFLVAEDFSEHMAPDVRWYEDPAYAEAFADLLAGCPSLEITGEDTMAAQTNTVDPITGEATPFPAYINIRFESGRAVVTARGDPKLMDGGGELPAHYREGQTIEVTLDQHDWDQFVAEATRERGLVPGG